MSVDERLNCSRVGESFLVNWDEAIVEVEIGLSCSMLGEGSEWTGWDILGGGGIGGGIYSSSLRSKLAGGDGGGGPTGTASSGWYTARLLTQSGPGSI